MELEMLVGLRGERFPMTTVARASTSSARCALALLWSCSRSAQSARPHAVSRRVCWGTQIQ